MSQTAVAAPANRAAAPPTTPPASEGGGLLTQRQIMLIVVGLMLGMFLAALDQMIVGTAIRTIADDLHGYSLQAWATTAYLITSTIVTPLYGKLSDMYGRKPFFLAAISIFIVGSIACTFSTSMYELAAFRGVQGLGAGGLMSLALAIIGDVVPPRQRAKYMGAFLSVWGTSSVIGPVLGGFFAGQSTLLGIAGWRWVFLVNVPIAAVALVVVAKVLHVPHTPRRHKIDIPGALALTVGLVPLLIVAEQGREWGWGSTRSVACYVIGGVGLILFVLAEKWAGEDALIPLRLFRGSVFSLMSAGGLVIGMVMFGAMVVIPQYMQVVHGASPTKSGLLMLPLVLSLMAGTMGSGQITAKTGRYKIFPIIGSAMMIGGLLLMSRLGADTPLWQVDLYMMVVGLGLGQCMQTLTLAVQNAVHPKDMGVASSSSTFFRSMGGTLGTAVFLSIMFSTVGTKIGDAFKSAFRTSDFQSALHDPKVLQNPKNKPVLEMLQHKSTSGGNSGVLSDTSFLQQIDHRLAKPFLVGFSNSMDLVFVVAAAVTVIAFVIFLVAKEVPLRMQSGVEARAAAEAAETGGAVPVGVAGGTAARDTVSGTVRATAPVSPAVGSPNGGARHAAGDRFGEPPLVPRQYPGTGPSVGAPPPPVGGWAAAAGGTPIRGLVRQPGGIGVPDAALTLIDAVGHQVGRAHAGPDGSFQLTANRPGNYVLIARARAHQPQATMVTVDSVPVQLDVLLAGSGGLVGAVRQLNGGPVRGATVILADVDGEVIASDITDTSGEYEFGELIGGSYTLAVNAPLYQPAALLVDVPETGRVRQDLELVGGAQLRGTAWGGPDRRPVPDARVSLVDGSGQVVAGTVTDAAGRYAFSEVPAGAYTVVATGYPPVRSQLELSVGERYDHDVELRHPEH